MARIITPSASRSAGFSYAGFLPRPFPAALTSFKKFCRAMRCLAQRAPKKKCGKAECRRQIIVLNKAILRDSIKIYVSCLFVVCKYGAAISGKVCETEMWTRSVWKVVTGDITKIDADAIVNPTDVSCSGSGGIDFAIHRAAGADLKAALCGCERLDAGEARVTPAFDLRSAKWIIHTVGPRWENGFSLEEFKLAECYRNSLRIAFDQKCKSVAFPCISTGAGGFPADRAAEIAVRTVLNTLVHNWGKFPAIDVIFVCPEEFGELYKKHLKKAIIDSFVYHYAPESVPGFSLEAYYTFMRNLALLEWGNMESRHQYHINFAKPDQICRRGLHSVYDAYVQNMECWDYNTCLAYIMELFKPPYTYDGTGLLLPQSEQCMNGTVRRVLLRMRRLLG